MFLSRNLLNYLFPFFKEVSDSGLEKMVNAIGVEVESIFRFEKTDNLIVGQIKSVKKHPKSNHLNICEVWFENKMHTIICGADNVRVDLKVIVAKVGTKMIDGRLIEARELLGVKSNGMICAYNELTTHIQGCTQEEIEGIIELDDDAKINDTNPLKLIGLDDTIFELKTPFNRNDLNSIIGLVYDLVPIYFKNQKLSYDFENIKASHKIDFPLKIDNKICSFLGVIEINDVKITKSNWQIKSWLINSNLTPKNLLVDLTNLNSLITGSPCHGYEKAKVANGLEVKLVDKDTNFVALNNKEYKLTQNSVMCVFSNNTPVAIAGIIGSKFDSISDNAKDIIFEFANFNHLLVRNTANKLGIKTEASTLFSKRVVLWLTYKAIDFFISLLKKLNFKVKGINFVGNKLQHTAIEFNEVEMANLLGIEYNKNEISEILESLNFNVENNTVVVPFYREDLLNQADLIEEIVKKIDINNLKAKAISDSKVSFDLDYYEENRVFLEKYFINRGFSFVKSLNLTSHQNNDFYNLLKINNSVKIVNPISSEREFLRHNLIQQHLEILAYNFSHKNNLVDIFEIQGLTYNQSYHNHLCICFTQDYFKNKINGSKLKLDIFLVKSLLTDLFNLFHINYEFKPIDKNWPNIVLQKNGLEIWINKKLVGYMSQVNPEVLHKIKINDDKPIYFAELVIDDLLNNTFDFNPIVESKNKAHKIVRNITITVNKDAKFVDYFSIFKNYENQLHLINNCTLESIFQKDDNVSYSFSFQINDESLAVKENSEINKVFEKLILDLENAGAIVKR
ncbi:MAG: phenylalanine--tRNA ligase subunit beta [Malacoplasma sp.]|nr:phenylalanine--tRNA ligase subunit beta [Malacoplasma sp.]